MTTSGKKNAVASAIAVAEAAGIENLTFGMVEDASGISQRMLVYYFRTVAGMKDAVAEWSVESDVYSVIAQAVAYGRVQFQSLNDKTKEAVLAHFKGE